MEENKKSKLQQIYIGGVSQKHLLYFTKNLSILLKSGSTLAESLAVLREQAKGQLQSTLDKIVKKTQAGLPFSDALREHKKTFNEIYINIVKIGEESGTLEKNIEYLADQIERNNKLRKKIIGAMIYPMIILIGTLLLGTGVTIFVLPKIGRVFKSFKVALPWTTRALIAISDFIQNHGTLAGAIFIGTIVLVIVIWRLKATNPFTHKLILITPVVGKISKDFNLSMFYRNLSILLKSGTTIDEGIKICSQTLNNHHYKKVLTSTFQKIKGGGALYTILKDKPKFFPITDTQIISVGEESGTLADSLAYAADIHDSDLQDITKNLSTIMEPVLFVILGLIVGLLAMSIITPIYSITDQFRVK